MRVHINYQGLEKQSKKSLNAFIGEQVDRLGTKLGSLSDHDVSLRGTLQKHGKHRLFRFGSTLHLLHKTIAAEEEGEDAHVVIRHAFEELERQALKYKSRLKNEHMWKRTARRKQLIEKMPETVEPVRPAKPVKTAAKVNWFDEIKPVLDDLYDFAVREITYLQADDELRPDDLMPDELVDSVVVSSYEKQTEKPGNMDTSAWLHQIAINILDDEIAQSHERRKNISTETVIPDDDIDTNLFEFYQPDEVLKLEDLIESPEELPEAEASQLLVEQREAQSALSHLPHTWRRAALLRYASGFQVDQIAAIMRVEKAVIEDLLDTATRFLAERVDRSGLADSVHIERLLRVRRKAVPSSFHDELQSKFKE